MERKRRGGGGATEERKRWWSSRGEEEGQRRRGGAVGERKRRTGSREEEEQKQDGENEAKMNERQTCAYQSQNQAMEANLTVTNINMVLNFNSCPLTLHKAILHIDIMAS